MVLLACSAPALLFSGSSSATPARSRLATAQDRLEQLIHQQAALGERYDRAATHLEGTQADLGALNLKISRLRELVADAHRRAVEVAVSMYENGSFTDTEFLLSAKSMGDLQARVQTLGSVGAAQTDVFESLARARQRLTQRLDDAGRQEHDLLSQQERLSALKARLDRRVSSQSAEVDHLQAVVARIEARRTRREQLAAARASAAAPVPEGFKAHPAPATNPAAATAVKAALAEVGKPYVWAAAGPDAFDCSGLTMWAWGKAGVSLPHNAGEQYTATTRVSQAGLQPGDLVFYYHPIEHVAMYIGNDQMVEAPHTGALVRVVPLRTADYAGAGRP